MGAINIPKHLDPLANLPVYSSLIKMCPLLLKVQDLIGLRANYNYRDSPSKVILLENSGGDQNMSFLSLISDRPEQLFTRDK